MNEWQSIETAPKDGSEILATNEDGQLTVAAWRDESGPPWCPTLGGWYPRSEGWWVEHQETVAPFKARLWMPIPEVPNA